MPSLFAAGLPTLASKLSSNASSNSKSSLRPPSNRTPLILFLWS
jgi:hypothetical protein